MRKLIVVLTAGALFAGCGANGVLPGGTPSQGAFERHAAPANDGSVTYQANAAHTGYLNGTLRPPLTEAWAVNLGNYNGEISYPVVANGIVVVAANGKLVALDAKSGKIRWSKIA